MHDPVSPDVLEPLKFHHRAVIELKLLLTSVCLLESLDRYFRLLKFFNNFIPSREVKWNILPLTVEDLDAAIPCKSPQADFGNTHQVKHCCGITLGCKCIACFLNVWN